MTYDEHIAAWKHHSNAAIIHIHSFTIDGLWTEYEKYKEHAALANKHFGIAQMMSTKEINRLKAACVGR